MKLVFELLFIYCVRILRDTEKKHDFECESRRMPTPLSMNSSFTIVITIFSEFLVAAAAALHFPLLRIESIREEFSYFPHSIFTETFSHFINNKPLRFESLFSSFFSSFLHYNHFSPYNNSTDVLYFLFDSEAQRQYEVKRPTLKFADSFLYSVSVHAISMNRRRKYNVYHSPSTFLCLKIHIKWSGSWNKRRKVNLRTLIRREKKIAKMENLNMILCAYKMCFFFSHLPRFYEWTCFYIGFQQFKIEIDTFHSLINNWNKKLCFSSFHSPILCASLFVLIWKSNVLIYVGTILCWKI